MVQHPGADHMLEISPQLAGTFHRKLLQFQVFDAVHALEALSLLDALGADIDANDSCPGPSQRHLSCLGGAATSNQDASVVAIRFGRPEQAGIGLATGIVPMPPVPIEVSHRRRIGMTFVKRAHSLRNALLIGRPDLFF